MTETETVTAEEVEELRERIDHLQEETRENEQLRAESYLLDRLKELSSEFTQAEANGFARAVKELRNRREGEGGRDE